MGTIVKLDSVQDYNELLGVETLHPLVSVVDFSELEYVRHCLKNFGFYCIFLKHLDCGPLLYGRNQYDYREGTLVFIAPGQVAGVDDGKVSYGYKGWSRLAAGHIARPPHGGLLVLLLCVERSAAYVRTRAANHHQLFS